MTTPWCDCPDELMSGHVSLQPVADVWVHGSCLRPSFAWWKAHEDYCFECGRSFSSPLSDVCSRCSLEGMYQSWAGLASMYRAVWSKIFGNRLTNVQ